MKRKILETSIGLILLIVSVAVSLVYFDGSVIDNNPLFLIGVLLAFLIGMGILFHAGRIDTSKMKFSDPAPSQNPQVLEKNKKMISDWNNVNEKRDKLRMVSVAQQDETQNNQ